MEYKMKLWNEYKTIYFLVQKLRAGLITPTEYKQAKRNLAA